MSHRRWLGSVFACLLALITAASPALAESVTVFAAASLKTALDQIGQAFEQETGVETRLVYAGSSVLARQIEQGAPADIFISANAAWMDRLEHAGLIAPETRFNLAGNRLVLIAHGPDATPIDLKTPDTLQTSLGEGRLAMALVDAVPAGIYGKAALQTLGQWQSVRSSIAQTDNVRAALALVATGEAPYGIVYATDAMAADGVTVVAEFPAASHPKIVYPAARVGPSNTTTERYLAFLRQSKALAILEAAGFSQP